MDLWNVSARAATAALGALVVLDVVLVGMALRSTHTAGIDATTVSAVNPLGAAKASTDPTGALPTSSTKASSTSERAIVPTISAQGAPLRTMLVALDNERAWRVHVGSCSAGGATLDSTADGGSTWVDAKVPLRTIVRAQPTDTQSVFVVGAGSSCSAEIRSTTDGGGTWGSADGVGGAWFRDLKNTRTVGAPGSATSQPCGRRAVVDLAVLSAKSARVLCADGLVRSTSNTGSAWTSVGKVTGGAALAVRSADPTQMYVARLESPECAGVQIMQVGSSVATSCILSAIPQSAGQVAISLVTGGGWVIVGDRTMRSTDNLETWNVS